MLLSGDTNRAEEETKRQAPIFAAQQVSRTQVPPLLLAAKATNNTMDKDFVPSCHVIANFVVSPQPEAPGGLSEKGPKPVMIVLEILRAAGENQARDVE